MCCGGIVSDLPPLHSAVERAHRSCVYAPEPGAGECSPRLWFVAAGLEQPPKHQGRSALLVTAAQLAHGVVELLEVVVAEVNQTDMPKAGLQISRM